MNNKVVVIGGGIAGMTAAGALAELGIDVVLLEKEAITGGHVKNWDRLFPNRRPGEEVIDFIGKKMGAGVEIRYGKEVVSINHVNHVFSIRTADSEMQNANGKMQNADSSMQNANGKMQNVNGKMQNADSKMQNANGKMQNVNGKMQNADSNMQSDGLETLTADSIVLATGYELFDARRKEEYGYGIYDNVITSAELEAMFKEGKKIATHDGKTPQRIGIIHCVGSRDEKVGNLYCSKVCCVTGVKQAIEIREMLPECEVYSFYMDLRMYDRNFEELYYEAQQKWGVNFIRGRLSECAEKPDHSLVLKTEDTLTGRPLKMTVDMMVLLVGFIPRPETLKIATMLGLESGTDGFLLSADEHFQDNSTSIAGVFLAGAVKGPACIVNTIADARATAMQVKAYLEAR